MSVVASRRRWGLAALALCQAASASALEPSTRDAGLAAVADAGVPALAGDAGPPAGPPALGVPALTPPTLLADARVAYPEALRERRVTGDVQLTVIVDESGEVAQTQLVSGPDPLLNQAALEAATRLRFTPALQGGQPVAVAIGFTYHFVAPGPQSPVAVARLTGLVRTRGTRKPIALAQLQADSGEATETDAAGRFSLVLAPGKHQIVVRAAEHKDASYPEVLATNQVLEVVYGLTPGRLNPYETVVRADRDRAEVTRLTLSGAELQETPGTLGDPFRVIMLLPSVGSIATGIAYPIVRGSEPASTGYFVDGVEVPILFHLLLGPSVIHPDFIDHVDFYPGAPPPEYGRLIGGVVDGATTKPHDDRVHASLYLDLINSGAFVEVPIKSTGTDITAAGRFSYTGWLTALVANTINPQASGTVLNFDDYQLRVDQKVGGGSLRLFFFGSDDEAGADQPQNNYKVIQTVKFLRLDLRYRHALWGGEGEVGVTLGSDDIGLDSNTGSASQSFSLTEDKIVLRALFHRDLSERWRLRLGADLDYRASDLTVGDQQQGLQTLLGSLGQSTGSFGGVYGELTYHWGPWLISPGLRLENYLLLPSTDQVALEPRLSVRRQLTESLTLKGGAGFYTEPPVALISLPAVELGELGLGLQQAVQLDVGTEWTFWHDYELNVDVYLNLLTRTVELNYSGIASSTQAGIPYSPASHGYAVGAEVLLRHRFSQHWYGWLAYSLSHSVRSTVYPLYDSQGLMSGIAQGDLPYVFDQTHILNLVFSYQLPKQWELGAVLHFNSGRPETGLLTSNTERAGVNAQGSAEWFPADQSQASRLPDFFRVDLRVSKVWVYDAFTIEGYFDFLNASISQEVVAYQYEILNNQAVRSPVAIPIVLPYLGVKARY